MDGLVADALSYCDMTTSPDGDPVEVADRVAEAIARYGHGHPVAESIKEAQPLIERSAEAVRARVAS